MYVYTHVCVGGVCVHEHAPLLPAHTFPHILPHKAGTVSHIEMSEDYGFPAEPESSLQGCIVSCTEHDCSSWQPRIPDFSHSLQSREASLMRLVRQCETVSRSRSFWCISPSQPVASPPSGAPPSLLSPLLLSCCFLFWSYLSFPPVHHSREAGNM